MLNIFDLTLRINGFPIKEATKECNKNQELSDSEFEEFQSNSKKQIVEYHLKNNSMYNKLVGDISFSSWESLPIMTKADFQKPLKERLSKGFTIKNVYVNKTSGSSGHPFVFAKDKFCHAMTWVHIFKLFNWHSINFNTSYQARFYGIPLDFVGNTKERLKDYLGNRYRFSIYDLSDKAFEKIVLHFYKKKFNYINGYTSSIVLFAKFLEKKQLVLKTICPTLTVCIVTAEMLFETDRLLLEKQFGIPVVNEYGASELGIIAFQNQKMEWQVDATSLFVEIVDEENNPLPYGKEGRIVITSLFNKAHPFIRYAIGDYGKLSEKSTLKKPLLEQLIGRTNDFVSLPSGKQTPGLTFYYITKSIIEDDGNVKEFIIRQIKINAFEIQYISERTLTSNQITQINKTIEVYLEKGLNFTFERKKILERSKSGKLKQFERLF